MINAHPNVGRINNESNNDGELPIHLALQLGRSEKVIIALLIAYPESVERCKPVNMKKLHPNVQEALARPIDYWEAKSACDWSASVSEVHAELIDRSDKACEDQISEKTISNEASAVRNVTDDEYLNLRDEKEALKRRQILR